MGVIAEAEAEEEEELKQIFGELDSDGDGKISAAEARRILELLGSGPGSSSLEEAAEADSDGFIGLEEFVAMSRSCSIPPATDSDHGPDPDDSDLVDAFRIFDLDRNGCITADELHTVLSRLTAAATACSFDDCRRMIMRADHKGLGHVDFDDFKLMMSMPNL
jgi:calcium-binding protein CML